jgi:hypothetical protein
LTGGLEDGKVLCCLKIISQGERALSMQDQALQSKATPSTANDVREVIRLRAEVEKHRASHAAYRKIMQAEIDQFLDEIDRLGARVLSLMAENDQLRAKIETLHEQHTVEES